jgi:hypothetical protein
MRRQHPDHKMDIPVSMKVWNQLNLASIATAFKKEDWEIAAEAIDEWVRRHSPDAISNPLVHGYQWKSVFLPDGTLLRTVFGGKNHHCMVEADRLIYNGKAISPSRFVNAVGGIRRNAWRCIWVLFPNTNDWKLADTLRGRERPRRARKPARDIQPAPAPQATPIHVPEQRNRRQSAAKALTPPGATCSKDQLMHDDQQIVEQLRQEILPLLHRLSAFEGKARAARASPR